MKRDVICATLVIRNTTVSFPHCCINYRKRTRFINVALFPRVQIEGPNVIAEVEESPCEGNGAAINEETASSNYSPKRFATAVNSLTNRILRPRYANVSVIVDIVVDRSSIFAGKRIIDVFMSWTIGTGLLTCSTFVCALFVRRTP